MRRRLTDPKFLTWAEDAYELHPQPSRYKDFQDLDVLKGSQALNAYGESGRILPADHGYGHDINFDRQDNIDLLAQEHIDKVVFARGVGNALALDLGCGFGRQSVEFALLGADVAAIDLIDTSLFISRLLSSRMWHEDREINDVGKVQFFKARIEKTDPSSFQRAIDAVYSQRSLHYLRYNDSLKMLKKIRSYCSASCQVFVGVSGLDSPLGDGYGDFGAPIQKRFSTLDLHNSEIRKHNIIAPVCLYRPDELEQLMIKAGFRCDFVETSEFGNVKGVFHI